MELLPDELILFVLQHSDARSLWALSLVNKRLATIVKPELYERYSFDRGHPELFPRSVAASPDLGTLIKHIDWDNESSDANSHAHYLLSARDERYVLRRVRQCHGSPSPTTRVATRIYPWEFHKHPSIDPYLAAILLLTPQLEELRIARFSSWSINQGWLHLPLAKSSPLSNLKKLSISRFIGYYFNLVPFLMLPSLRTVEIEYGAYFTFGYEGRDSHAKSSVEHLHLVGQTPQSLHIAAFAGVIRNLKTFSLRCRNTGAWYRPECFIPLTDLLRDQCNSLEDVSLRQGMDSIGFKSVVMAQCFKDAKNLRSLETTIPVDPKHDRLPQAFQNLPDSLEKLTIRLELYTCDELAVTLRTIAHSIHDWVSNLKTLTLIGWDRSQRSFLGQADLAALQTVFAKFEIPFLSQAYESEYADIFALDYVEPEWSWIQPMHSLECRAGKEWKWVAYIENNVRCVDECSFDMEDDVDWVRIHTYDGYGVPCAADVMVEDQYLTEQPVWYWNELQRKRTSAEMCQ